MAKKKTTQPRLTLHQLLGAISFWGTSVRLLLVAFLTGILLVLRLLYADVSIESEVQIVIYVLGSFALLDIGYVMLARTFPLRRHLDAFCLILVEVMLAASFIIPNLIDAPALTWFARWTVLIVLLALSVRGLIGLLFSNPKKR